jgi:hypothetical protein|tara:strand:- start:299 stop:568 length:270 start_codon:yes stop_codon:yes gene_type:complete
MEDVEDECPFLWGLAYYCFNVWSVVFLVIWIWMGYSIGIATCGPNSQRYKNTHGKNKEQKAQKTPEENSSLLLQRNLNNTDTQYRELKY